MIEDVVVSATVFWTIIFLTIWAVCAIGLLFHREQNLDTRNFMLFIMVWPMVLITYIVFAVVHFIEGSYILFSLNSGFVTGLAYFGYVKFKKDLHKTFNPFPNKHREGYKWAWLRDTVGWLDTWKRHVKIMGWKGIWKRYAHGGLVPTSGRIQMRRSANSSEELTASGGLMSPELSDQFISELTEMDMSEAEERVVAATASEEINRMDLGTAEIEQRLGAEEDVTLLGLHVQYGARNEDLRSFAMRLLRENRALALFNEIGEWSDDFIISTVQDYLDRLGIEERAVLHRSLEVRFEENPITYTQPMDPQELYNQYYREPESRRNLWRRILQQGLQSSIPEIWDALNNEQMEQVVRGGLSALDELQWEEFHQRMEYIPGITMPPELRMTEDQWRTLNDLGYQFEVDRDIGYQHDTIIILHRPTDCMCTFIVRYEETLVISDSVMEELVNFETGPQQSTSEAPTSSFDVDAGTPGHVTDESGVRINGVSINGVRINETQVFARQGNIGVTSSAASSSVQTQALALEIPAWVANMDQEALRELIEESHVGGTVGHKARSSLANEDMINQLILDKNELNSKIVELKEIIARLLADRSIYKRQVKIRRSRHVSKR